MIRGTKDELQKIADSSLCAEHEGRLTVVGVPAGNCYSIKCENDHYVEGIIPMPTLTDLHKQGEELPEPMKTNVQKGMVRHSRKPEQNLSEALVDKWLGTDLATGNRIDEPRIGALMLYARKYGLDPLRGHIVVMYGAPYITIDGYLYHAHHSNISFSLKCRPLKPEEYADYKIPADDHAWLATVTLTASMQEFTGLGVVQSKELTEESKKTPGQLRYPVVAAHPWQLAQKRAEWQALRRAFPIGEEAEPNDH